jgi:hypothetical protein
MKAPGRRNMGEIATMVSTDKKRDVRHRTVQEKLVDIEVSIVSKSFESLFRMRPEVSVSPKSISLITQNEPVGVVSCHLIVARVTLSNS